MKTALKFLVLAVFLLTPVCSYAQENITIPNNYEKLKAEFKLIDFAIRELRDALSAIKAHNSNIPPEQVKEDNMRLHEIISTLEERYGYNENINSAERQRFFMEK